MGYMGFGMQKWIYSRKPRKPFSKERTPGYDSLPGHANDEFSGCGVPSQNMESIDERISMGKRRILRKWIRNRLGDLLLAAIILAIVVWIVIRLSSQIGIWSSDHQSAMQKEAAEVRQSYALSMEYGITHFEKGEYEEAIREFKNAVRLNPKDTRALEALAGVYNTLCLNENRYCNDAILTYNQLIELGKRGDNIRARNKIEAHVKNIKSVK
jgi:tetratricopeptide (TPR) repeat protein